MTRDLSRASVVGYLRVSTERQAGESVTSIADQRRAIVALAHRMGRTVDEWFSDEGASGATVEKRPAFCELRDSCEAFPRPPKSGGLVLCLNDSRFGRFPDPEESTFWRFFLQRLGWTVRFAEGDDVEDVMGRGVLRFVASAQASQYRHSIVANAQRGSKGAAELGYWTREAPFGYRRAVVYPVGRERVLDLRALKAPDEKVKLVPHDAEAAIVRQMFDRYASGADTLGSIQRWLEEVIPDRIVWSRATVQMVLKNPAYTGDVVGGRRGGDGSQYGRRDAHVPLISRELYAAVQARFGTNRKNVRGVPGKYVVSGLVTCTTCGEPYIGGGLGGRGNTGPHWFYKCASGANEPPYRGNCDGRVGTISKHILEGAVVSTIASELKKPGMRRAIEREIDRMLSSRPVALETEMARVRKDLASATRRRDNLIGLVSDGTITQGEAKAQLVTLRDELTRLTDRETSLRFEVAGSTVDPRLREEVVALAADFPAIAARLSGVALRQLVVPWLAAATFDKTTRLLTLHIRKVPGSDSLPLSSQPGPSRQQQRQGLVVRTVDLSQKRVG